MKLLPLLALLAIPIAHGADTTPAEKTDFAVGFDLQTSTTAPAYRVALHPETYRQLQRYDLADLAVFNSAGQPVPHALERPEAEETLPTQRPLPFYAIAKEGGQIAGALKLRVDAGGAVVQMEAPATAPDADASSAWIIDAGDESAQISALRLAWDGAPEGFLRHARLETGAELGSWQTLAEGTLADLEREGARLVQDTLTLSTPPARYLRLRLDAGDGITLRTVLALTETGPRQQESWTSLAPAPDPESGGWVLDTGGPLPVEHLRVRLPTDNDMAEFEIFSRAATGVPWEARGRVLAYRLTAGDALVEDGDAAIDLTRDRYWRLQLAGTQRTAPAGTPRVEVGWTPDQVVFLARGGGPYTLAAGSGARRVEPQPLGSLWQSLPGGSTAVQAAGIGEMRELGGATALEPARQPVPWQRYLMWALLTGAVVLLGLMARSLLRTARG